MKYTKTSHGVTFAVSDVPDAQSSRTGEHVRPDHVSYRFVLSPDYPSVCASVFGKQLTPTGKVSNVDSVAQYFFKDGQWDYDTPHWVQMLAREADV